MACGCGGCTGENSPSAGVGVRASPCGCGGSCGGGEVAVNGEILRPGGLPPDVECGKGLPSGLLLAGDTIRPLARTPKRVVLTLIGAIDVDDDGNMFFGMAERLRRTIRENSWSDVLIVPPSRGAVGSRSCINDDAWEEATRQAMMELHAHVRDCGRIR